MNKPFSYKALEQLIAQVEAARPSERPIFYHTVNLWKAELLSNPEYFNIYDGELLYCGVKVGFIGNEQREIDRFLQLASQIISERYQKEE